MDVFDSPLCSFNQIQPILSIFFVLETWAAQCQKLLFCCHLIILPSIYLRMVVPMIGEEISFSYKHLHQYQNFIYTIMIPMDRISFVYSGILHGRMGEECWALRLLQLTWLALFYFLNTTDDKCFSGGRNSGSCRRRWNHTNPWWCILVNLARRMYLL